MSIVLLNKVCCIKDNNIAFKSRCSLEPNVVESIKAFKSGAVYKINEKLRGINIEPLASEEEKLINDLTLLPRKVLSKDTYVYRGVGDSYNFDPVETLKGFMHSGQPFEEKGFTSTSPIMSVAKKFQYARGVLERILLPKGTEVVNIDSLLLQNIYKLSDEDFINITTRLKRPRHEWVLLPNAKYNITSFSDKNKYVYWVDSNGKRHKFIDNCIGIFDLNYVK